MVTLTARKVAARRKDADGCALAGRSGVASRRAAAQLMGPQPII
jgi:hypothetical protein